MTDQVSQDFLSRLTQVEIRLVACANMQTGNARTAADPASGEQWEAGQVWAHVTEFIPYWLSQTEMIVAANRLGGGTPFGRTKADPKRIAAIEVGRAEPRPQQLEALREDISDLRAFLTELNPLAWALIGIHPTLGEMSLARLVDEFLVGHLEEHADQLEALG